MNSERCVDITIIDDDIIENDQSFGVSLTSNDPVFITPISEAVVVIATDNDSKRKICSKKSIIFIVTITFYDIIPLVIGARYDKM